MEIAWRVSHINIKTETEIIVDTLNGPSTDLFLTCEDPRDPTKRSFQVWLNNKNRGFVFAGEWKLPPGAGAITFADMGEPESLAILASFSSLTRR